MWVIPLPQRCESIVGAQKKRGEGEGRKDVKEQTGTGTDVRSGLDVRFSLQPVEKNSIGCRKALMWTDAASSETKMSYFIGTICVKPAVCDRCAVPIDLLCGPQVAETGLADLHGAGNGKPARPQLGKNMQFYAVIPQVSRGISREIAEIPRRFRSI